MAHSTPDPFEGLVLDDAFVAAAELTEPATAQRLRGRPVRRVRPWLGMAVQTCLVLATAVVLAVWSFTGFGTRPSPTGGTAALRAARVTGADPLPVPEPWNDPIPAAEITVGPDWLAVGPPST